MKKLIYLSAFLLLSLAGSAQSKNSTPALPEEAFIKVDSAAGFPGGLPAWQEFLANNLGFPQELANKTKGRKTRRWKVVIGFIVTAEGKLTDLHPVTRLGNGLEEEAMRVLKLSPDWIPAKQKGKAVSSYFRQPFIFVLETEK